MKCVTLLVVAFLLCATVVNAQTIFGVPKQICGTQTITAAIGNFTSSQPLVITVSTSSPLVTVSPSTVTFTRNGTEQDITIGCNQIGPVEITFAQSSAGIGLRQSFFAFCAGSISVSNPPQSVRRGDEFSLDVVLSPTPSKEVNVIVESLDPYIIPGSERIIFAVQQSIANQLFYAPKAGVGPARIIFNSRSLRDYTGPGCAELVIDINVQGEISTNLNDIVVGQNSTVLVTVTISPPAETDNIIINIDTQGLGFAPASLNFSLGQSEQTFNFTLSPEVLSGDSGCIALGGDFYEKTLSCFGIAGSFRTNIDSEVNTFANEVFSLDLLPNAGGAGVSVNVESSPNVRIIGDFEIPAYGSNTIFILDAVAPGPAFVEFSADGYAKLLYNFTVISVGCTANQSISSSGEYCVNCPSLYSYRNVSDPDDGNFQYDICDGSGTCSFSTFNPFVGRCVCDSFNFGPSCQFFVLDEDDIVAEYGVGSQIMSITTDIIPLTRNTTINFSSTMVTGENAGDIAFFLQPYGEDFFPFTGSASPFLLPPTVINKTAQIVESGFRFDVTTEDNTPVRTLNSSIEFIFQFRKNLVTQAQFLQLQLFYFDEAIESFVPASETCVPYAYDKDIYTYTVRVFLCRTGQYQFFSVGPKAAHQIVTRTSAPQDFNAFDQDRYFLGSNQFGGLAGGENGRIPPQPTFVQQTIVEQQAIDQARLDQISLNQASSASYVHASVFAVLLAVALALI